MSEITPPEITARVMAAERSWLVPVGSINTQNTMETNPEIEPVVTLVDAKAEAQKNYWSKMTAKEKSAEMKRRMANRKPRKKESDEPDKAQEAPVTRPQKVDVETESPPPSITIPPAFGCRLMRKHDRIQIFQESQVVDLGVQMIELHIPEAKLVAGALLNLVGKKD